MDPNWLARKPTISKEYLRPGGLAHFFRITQSPQGSPYRRFSNEGLCQDRVSLPGVMDVLSQC